jgi:hypothetical protein
MNTPFRPAKDAAEAREELRRIFPPGSTARTILRHVSASGMNRWISIIGPDAENLSWLVAAALGEKVYERAGAFCLRVPGCGMDPGFGLVYTLSEVLYRDGWLCQIGADTGRGPDWCPSNHHTNAGDWTHTEQPHTDGYAISQRWL